LDKASQPGGPDDIPSGPLGNVGRGYTNRLFVKEKVDAAFVVLSRW